MAEGRVESLENTDGAREKVAQPIQPIDLKQRDNSHKWKCDESFIPYNKTFDFITHEQASGSRKAKMFL